MYVLNGAEFHARINCMSDDELNKTKRLLQANKLKLIFSSVNERHMRWWTRLTICFHRIQVKITNVMLHTRRQAFTIIATVYVYTNNMKFTWKLKEMTASSIFRLFIVIIMIFKLALHLMKIQCLMDYGGEYENWRRCIMDR